MRQLRKHNRKTNIQGIQPLIVLEITFLFMAANRMFLGWKSFIIWRTKLNNQNPKPYSLYIYIYI